MALCGMRLSGVVPMGSGRRRRRGSRRDTEDLARAEASGVRVRRCREHGGRARREFIRRSRRPALEERPFEDDAVDETLRGHGARLDERRQSARAPRRREEAPGERDEARVRRDKARVGGDDALVLRDEARGEREHAPVRRDDAHGHRDKGGVRDGHAGRHGGRPRRRACNPCCHRGRARCRARNPCCHRGRARCRARDAVCHGGHTPRREGRWPGRERRPLVRERQAPVRADHGARRPAGLDREACFAKNRHLSAKRRASGGGAGETDLTPARRGPATASRGRRPANCRGGRPSSGH
jgi:hypothetical protein